MYSGDHSNALEEFKDSSFISSSVVKIPEIYIIRAEKNKNHISIEDTPSSIEQLFRIIDTTQKDVSIYPYNDDWVFACDDEGKYKGKPRNKFFCFEAKKTAGLKIYSTDCVFGDVLLIKHYDTLEFILDK